MPDRGPSWLKRQYWHYIAMRDKYKAAPLKLLALAEHQHRLAVDQYLRQFVSENPAYADPKRLTRFERQVFSQNGEDGVLAEIFKRIGTSDQPYFVEFGAGSGLENNSAFLLAVGWRGLWLEVDPDHLRRLSDSYSRQLQSGTLVVTKSLVTRDNVERLFAAAAVPREFDMLCIDIDGNDYWVWQAITEYRPRVVVMEYNALWPPDVEWIMAHDPDRQEWDGSTYYGASLKALTALGRSKGYALVGCTITGVNAFFVREDLVGDHFASPGDCAFHYEPARYHLVTTFGQPRGRH